MKIERGKMKFGKQEALIFVVVIFATLVLSVTAGCADEAIPSVEEWNNTFGAPCSEEAYSVEQTTDGEYVLVGYTSLYGAGGWDFWLVKTDSNGNEQWNNTFGGRSTERAYSVQQTTDGGYILAGYTFSLGAGYGDFWLVKTDSNGNEQWNNTFGGPGSDRAHSVQQTKDGGYIVAGGTRSYGAGDTDFWLVKTDSNGNERWNNTFGGPGSDRAHSVQQTKDGGYILAGRTRSYGAGSSDFWLVKTDSNGNEQWKITFGGPQYELAYSVQQTKDGGYIIAGDTSSYGAGSSDFWLVKTDSNGNEQWNNAYGGYRYERAESVHQTSDGGFIVAGCTMSYGAGDYDFWLVKTDSNGNEQWDTSFGGPELDMANSVQQTTDGGYILVGCTESYGTGDRDFWLVKAGQEYLEDENETVTPIQTKGIINVTSSPSGATIGLDGRWDMMKATPDTITDVPLGYHTLELTHEGYGDWSRSVKLTSGETLDVYATLTPASPYGNIKVNEIMYYPSPEQGDDLEWIELYNSDYKAINLSGWTINGILISGVKKMEPEDYVILAKDKTAFDEYYNAWSCPVIEIAIRLRNDEDTIVLKNATGAVIDNVTYNASLGANGSGATLQRNVTGGWEEYGGTPCRRKPIVVEEKKIGEVIVSRP